MATMSSILNVIFFVFLNVCTVRVCNNHEVRIKDGTVDYEGRAEYCKYGLWGTICDNSWTAEDAAVFCTQLGYPSKGKFSDVCAFFICVPVSTTLTTITGAVHFTNAAFGRGEDPIVFSGLGCKGTESSLDKCPSSSSFSCSHSEDAGVRCIGKASDPFCSLLKD